MNGHGVIAVNEALGGVYDKSSCSIIVPSIMFDKGHYQTLKKRRGL